MLPPIGKRIQVPEMLTGQKNGSFGKQSNSSRSSITLVNCHFFLNIISIDSGDGNLKQRFIDDPAGGTFVLSPSPFHHQHSLSSKERV